MSDYAYNNGIKLIHQQTAKERKKRIDRISRLKARIKTRLFAEIGARALLKRMNTWNSYKRRPKAMSDRQYELYCLWLKLHSLTYQAIPGLKIVHSTPESWYESTMRRVCRVSPSGKKVSNE